MVFVSPIPVGQVCEPFMPDITQTRQGQQILISFWNHTQTFPNAITMRVIRTFSQGVGGYFPFSSNGRICLFFSFFDCLDMIMCCLSKKNVINTHHCRLKFIRVHFILLSCFCPRIWQDTVSLDSRAESVCSRYSSQMLGKTVQVTHMI